LPASLTLRVFAIVPSWSAKWIRNMLRTHSIVIYAIKAAKELNRFAYRWGQAEEIAMDGRRLP